MLYKIELKNNNKINNIYYIFNNKIKIKLFKFIYYTLNINLFKYKNKNYINDLELIRKEEKDYEMKIIKMNIIDY